MGKPSILRRAFVGLLTGIPIGTIMYATFGLINGALNQTVIDPMVGLALGVVTAVALQFVKDLKEEENA